MNTVNVRGVIIGDGMPKICVPIVASSLEEILKKASEIKHTPADIVEWRADCFENVLNKNKVKEVLQALRDTLENIPLLFTFRTANEGGKKEIEMSEYMELNKMAIDSKVVDIIDVEMFSEDKFVKELLAYAKNHNIPVIGSSHDFEKTPPEKEILVRLQKMREMGATILKIAVMPHLEEDVDALVNATKTMVSQYAVCPVIAISMGELGKRTRISGEVFGSAMTFGMLEEGSAPGQIQVNELKKLLRRYKKASD